MGNIRGIINMIAEADLENSEGMIVSDESTNEITSMYDTIQSEINYDVNVICTIIVDKVLQDYKNEYNKELHPVALCTLIYDIFDVCKEHVRKSYE